jgi:hypothetical protein
MGDGDVNQESVFAHSASGNGICLFRDSLSSSGNFELAN